MDRIFVQTAHGMPWDAGAAAAFSGFRDMGLRSCRSLQTKASPEALPKIWPQTESDAYGAVSMSLAARFPRPAIQNPFRAISDAGSGVPPSMPYPAILNPGRSL